MIGPADLRAFIATHPAIIIAEIVAARGSSPREAGAFMLVADEGTIGTIGGGALEYLVIARARQVLRQRQPPASLDIPLGPELGQCCGGRVEVTLRRLDRGRAERLLDGVERDAASRPCVFLFGAGHVGRALARALAPLPVRLRVVDTRAAALEGLPDNVETIVSPMPEAVVRSAPSGSAFVILTHDHALDFMIAFEALRRDDSPYVAMVGSRTKRGRFASWHADQGGDPAALDRLVLPIGSAAFPRALGDKRPEVIAALAAAEILVLTAGRPASKDRATFLRRVAVGH